ncbi:VOC family protein [uncultured Friedmanniella sp.]|uniref:VOC family protein n=1 Tax=uncultured Friedmanniella sp. TaxID=335381 RepID=UPI0035CB277E
MTTDDVPQLRQVVLDTTDARALAEFYRELLGLAYRPGDEPPSAGEDDERGRDWLVLRGAGAGPDGGDATSIAFQQVEQLPRVTWPEGEHPQMLHLDLTVGDADALVRQRDRATTLGARVLWDRFDDPDEPLYVFADPAGHPFCIFVA